MSEPKRKKTKKAKKAGKKSPPAESTIEEPPPEKGEPAKAAPEPPESAKTSRMHLWRGLTLMAIGFMGTFLLMANQEQVSHGPLFGMLTMLVGVSGLLDVLGLFGGDEKGRIDLRETALFAKKGEPLALAPVVTVPLAIAILGIGVVAADYAQLPIVILLSLVPLLISALRRPALMVVVVASALFLPFLGAYGLWDPWETHYGEVAREMLARDDWISLWWAQEDFFWSKPILIFWIESLSMGALGVDFHPDANPLHPEWAIRLPHFLLTLGALVSVFALVSKVWSKRAGLVVATVLATMPHFFFLSHQAITDMPFVANITMAMSMFGLAVTTDADREVKRYGIGPITVSARHLIIGAISLVVIPQILYLCSRNVTFLAEFPPFGWHGDIFLSGSAGNHGVPGNSPVHNVEPFLSGPGAQPITQGVLWLCGYLGILWMLRKEKRARSLLMFAFYFFCGLGFMAKGIPGFALPGLVALFFLLGTKRWNLLTEGHLKVGAGILTVVTVGLPWYVAMFIRHGTAFTDRLLVHDHINRLTAGVHGDNASIEYFIEQMGYGMFPWIGFAPIALAAWLVTRDPKDTASSSQRDILVLAAVWLMAAFALFSGMTTKFHHYIFPAVPPAALLVGVAVNRLLRHEKKTYEWRRIVSTGLAVLAPLPAVIGVAGRWGDVRGLIPTSVTGEAAAEWALENPWSGASTITLIGVGIVMLAGAWWIDHEKPKPTTESRRWARGAMTTGLLAAPPILAMVGRDLSWITDARPQGYERLIQLFVYNYGRPWPEELDYRPMLTGFAIVATIIVVLAAVKPLRDTAMRAFLGLAMCFCVWSLDVYMIDLSPHWGQRELVQQYYDLRASDEEPLIAWQMNWKGENFYTGNRVHVFVQLDNRQLRTWLGENQGRTAYFLLEHSRLGNLRNVMRGSTIEEVTDMRFCNKFILIRAQIGVSEPEVRETLD